MVSNCILWQKSCFFLPKMQFTIIKSMITSSKDSLDSIILYFELHLEKAKGDRNIVIIIFFLFSLFFVIHFRVVFQYFLCLIKYRTILYRKQAIGQQAPKSKEKIAYLNRSLPANSGLVLKKKKKNMRSQSLKTGLYLLQMAIKTYLIVSISV